MAAATELAMFDLRKTARKWVGMADKVVLIGEPPEPDEELWVTVIVSGQPPIGARDLKAVREKARVRRALSDDNGYSEEQCIRCGWRMGSPPLNCQNDDTPHVFLSQLEPRVVR